MTRTGTAPGARGRAIACLCVLSLLSTARIAAAQLLPSSPILVGDGALTLGGNVTASVGRDDPGFFNYTDYQYSSLRQVRADVNGLFKKGKHFSVLGEVRVRASMPLPSDVPVVEGVAAEISALYVRIHPSTTRRFDIQIGRIPPSFGAFTRRAYGADNPLIGYPLAFQYLTSLRPDSIPADADELLRMRGRGWLSKFTVGNSAASGGVPLVESGRWDTGVQLHAANDVFEGTAAITLGTLSNPRLEDDNGGPQVAGRLAFHPVPGLILGASASRGPFLASSTIRAASAAGLGDFTQDAWGADAEYSAGRYVVRLETVLSRWRLPVVRAPFIDQPLEAGAISLEGRYKIIPGLYAAGRVEHLGFNTVTGSAGPRAWDAPVTRLETGIGYSLQRNVVLKVSYQFDKREDTRVSRSHLAATEVAFWF